MPGRFWLKLDHHFVFDTRFRQAAEATGTSYGICQGVALACAALDNEGKRLGPLDIERLAWMHGCAIEAIRKVIRKLCRLGLVMRRMIASLRKPRDREKHRLAQARYRRRQRLDPRQLSLLLPITGDHAGAQTRDHASEKRDHHLMQNNDLAGDPRGRTDHSVITRDHHPNKINDIASETGITRDHPRSLRDHPPIWNNGLAQKPVDHPRSPPPLLESESESEEETRTNLLSPPESSRPTHTLAALSAPPARASIDKEFKDTFWPAYPDTAKRHLAAKEFRGARRFASLDAIMAGLAAYKRSKPDWQQWAHAATWLRGRRWEDAAPADAAPKVNPELRRMTLESDAASFEKGELDPFTRLAKMPDYLAEFLAFYRERTGRDLAAERLAA